ncbi:serine hydrolase [Nesterenkonia sp.]|uniref:serine hydrolase n=1 Tax=Nesterenkonia sp. TaxID=704201 RepID=UPI0026075273|nr:serine hydrolase [Nesterenkonia sp.]
MRPRLPLTAGAPGTSVAALTAALLITGCAPNPFGSPEPGSVLPVSAVHAAPAAAGETAEITMSEAAEAVADRIAEALPQDVVAAGSTVEDQNAPDADDPDSESPDSEDPGQGGPLAEHHDELQSWAESLASAQQEAAERETAEQARIQAEQEEAERLAREEAEAQQEQEQELPQPAPELETPPIAPPTGEPHVEYTGDLNAYLSQLAEAHPGRIAISLQEISGQQRRASTHGSDTAVTASTYKLFVAYSIIRQVEAGEMDWEDDAVGDRSLAQCFQDMIIVSDNACPEAIGPEIGWTQIYSDAASAGAGSTGQGGGAIVTSPNDLTSLLVRLETGQLSMSAAGHDRMRNALAANVHRQGIPAGSAGQVLNKPGWINGRIHDAAIVRHPQGTYVLSIMSTGSTWTSVAAITRDIERALYGQ